MSMQITFTIPMTESDVRGAAEHLSMMATMLRQIQPVADEAVTKGSLPVQGGAEIVVGDVAAPGTVTVQAPPRSPPTTSPFPPEANAPPPPPAAQTPVPPPPSGDQPSQRAPGQDLAPAIERPTEVETDSAGVAWDPALHAGKKQKKQDGTWKARRGSGADTTPSTPAATAKQVQMVMGGLLAKGVDLDECNKAISIAVSCNEDCRTGGMGNLKASNDPAGCDRALQALKALAVTSGV